MPPKNNPSQAKLSRLDELDKQIQGAQATLAQLQSAVATVSSRRSKIAADIQADSDRLIAERAETLSKLEFAAGERMKPIADSIEAAKSELVELEMRKSELSQAVSEANKRVVNVQLDIDRKRSSLEATENALDDAEQRKMTAEGAVLALEQRQNELKTAIASLSDECNALETQKQGIESRIASATEEWQRNEQAYNERVAVAEQKLAAITGQIRESQAAEEAVRAELATRIKALDERDKVLRVRELRVSQDEEKIRHNASLLNL